MPLNSLTKQDIRSACGSTYFNRGLNYYRSGRVLDFDLPEADNLVHASVSGSGRRIYEQVIYLSRPRTGGISIDGSCTCPMCHNCKHVAAALLDVLEYLRLEKKQATVAPVVQEDRLLSWQQQTLEQLKHEQNDYYTANRPEVLLYFLQEMPHSGSNVLVCEAHKSRKLKRGGWGKTTKYDLSNLNGWYSAPTWVAPVDSDIAALLIMGNSFGTHLQVKGDTGLLALQKMIASGRCYWENADQLTKPGARRRGQLIWQIDDSAQRRLTLQIDESAAKVMVLPTDPPYYLDLVSYECGLIEQPLTAGALQSLLQLPPVAEDQLADISVFLDQTFPPSSVPLPIQLDIRPAASVPTPKLLLLRTKSLPGAMVHIARVRFNYHPVDCIPSVLQQNSTHQLVAKDDVQWRVVQDAAAEGAYLRQLEGLGLQKAAVGGVPFVGEMDLLFAGDSVTYSASCWKAFLDRVPELESQGWVVELDASFALEFAVPDALNFQLGEDLGDWFEMGLELEYHGQRFPLLPLLTQWLEQGGNSDQLLVQLDDGRWLCCSESLIAPICETLIELFDAPKLNASGQLKLHRSQIYQLTHLEKRLTDHGETLSWHGGEQLHKLAKKLESFSGLEAVPSPVGLQATLRDYQLLGLSWMQFLREYRFNGILADDMGLGKTLQTLAHLLTEKEAGRLLSPALIVAPTSVLSIWKSEAQRFTPDLRVLVLHGPQRKNHFGDLAEYDLVVTSYALLTRDLEVYQHQPFSALILDEAQAIKNPRAKVAQSAAALQVEHRLCLTGTPVENHLGELWSLFHFLMPGLLGSEKQFRKLFRKPIEQQGNTDCQQELQRRLLPFVMRRDKHQVATELPAKTTIVRLVDMGESQVRLYESVRTAMSKKVRQLLDKKGIKNSHIEILEALLKLRQACCDPRLVKLESAKKVTGSAKLEQLLDMLEQLLEEGRKILLFSQFTSMLSLIETELQARSIDYTKLTGRTIKRDLAISRFQDGEVPLFLISLKAGGVGLNLTAADTVIHYDPWWNPAVENQATDRAYRIGQDKPVFVYKLIARGTVEEKIIQLQEKKQHLADGVYAEGGQREMARLSGDDLLALLEQ